MPIQLFSLVDLSQLFFDVVSCHMGGRSSVVRASEFKSEDPGFDPLAGQDNDQFFCPSESTLVQTCLCLNPHRVRHTPKFCVHIQDPIAICRKRVGLTAGGMVTQK